LVSDTTCEICARVAAFTPENPYIIAELDESYAVLADNQYYPGYTIVLSKTCVPELHLLPPAVRGRFLEEMALVAEALFRAFSPRKLNYELLGNSVSHLHWHLFPRYDDDPDPKWPVWRNDAFLAPPACPDRAILKERREKVRQQLALLR
jgi:diadenosine tetraphosphate (Ap4A) HIT family hydrolase